MTIAGLIFSGAGLAGGFPLMLGITIKYFAERSGTAFSLFLRYLNWKYAHQLLDGNYCG